MELAQTSLHHLLPKLDQNWNNTLYNTFPLHVALQNNWAWHSRKAKSFGTRDCQPKRLGINRQKGKADNAEYLRMTVFQIPKERRETDLAECKSHHFGASFPFFPFPTKVCLLKNFRTASLLQQMRSKKWPNFSFLLLFFLENGDLPFIFPVGIQREQSVNPFGSSSVVGERNTAVQRFSFFFFLSLFISHTHTLSLSLSLSLPLSFSLSPTLSISPS